MSFLAAYDAAGADKTKQLLVLRQHLRERFDDTCSELRANRPFLKTPIGTFVTRFEDVREALRSMSSTGTLRFSVQEPGRRMAESLGAFFLGYDLNTPEYRKDLEAAKRVLGVDQAKIAAELGRIRELVRERADLALGDIADDDFDVVSQYGNVVVAGAMAEYFGLLPPLGEETADVECNCGQPAPPPTEVELLEWFQIASFYVFNPLVPVALKAPAVRAAQRINHFAQARVAQVKEELKAHLDKLKAHLQDPQNVQPPEPLKHETVLTRLLEHQVRARINGPLAEVSLNFHDHPGVVPDDVWVRRMLVGLFSGSVVPTTGLFANVLDGLTHKKDVLNKVPFDLNERADLETVRKLMHEAMRRGPYPSLLQRTALTNARVPIAGTPMSSVTNSSADPGAGQGPFEHTFEPGEKIVLVIASALRDESAFEDAHLFVTGRNPNEVRLAFGLLANHQCLGLYHAEAAIEEMIMALLHKSKAAGGSLQRVGGPEVAMLRDPIINTPKQLMLTIERVPAVTPSV